MAVSNSDLELSLIRKFFGERDGFFVEVGANHPKKGSQSWDLEQRGWHGILVEPQPQLAAELRNSRRAKVFEVACSSPQNAGHCLPFHVAGPMSSLDRDRMAPGAMPEATINVSAITLDEILASANAPRHFDFLSIDVEGHEIEVLRGFTFDRWKPRLILLEDHVSNLKKHRFMKSADYRLVRRTGHNGWYVPASSEVEFDWKDRWEVMRKYYLALPFRIFRNLSRRLRQPFKDRRQAKIHLND